MDTPHHLTLEEAGLVFIDAGAYTDEALFHAAAAKLRHEDPVHWVENERVNPFYVITKHADVIDIELHPTEFLNAPRAHSGNEGG